MVNRNCNLRERGRAGRAVRRRHDAAGCVAPRAAAATTTTTTNLAPTEQETTSPAVAEIIAREHYRRAPLDDHLSSLILDRYLDAIGRQKLLYASDIAEFERHRYELDDAIKSGDVEPAFVIFRRYQQRSRERMAYAIDLLSKKPDFEIDESFNLRPRERTLAPPPRRR